MAIAVLGCRWIGTTVKDGKGWGKGGGAGVGEKGERGVGEKGSLITTTWI